MRQVLLLTIRSRQKPKEAKYIAEVIPPITGKDRWQPGAKFRS
jgi:hypothetical protein